MKLAVILAALTGSAAAFAPAPGIQATRTALNADVAEEIVVEQNVVEETVVEETVVEKTVVEEIVAQAVPGDFTKEIGAQAPLGFFDPLGMMSMDDADQDRFDHLRWVELKHGRVSMLAVVGYLVTYAGVRFPGAEDIPSGFAALGAIPRIVWSPILLTLALMEMVNRDVNEDEPLYEASGAPAEFKGDFRNGVLDFGWNKFSPDQKMRKRAIELNNGRAAQMGILGLMVHEKLGNIDLILPPYA